MYKKLKNLIDKCCCFKKTSHKFSEIKSLEEWEKIEKEWKQNHPILYILRETYYWCYRLWNHKIAMIPKEIKWFCQRGRRGYSDCDVWSFDWYLAEVISKGCKQLAKEKHGYPYGLTEEEWDVIINKISDGFEEYMKIIDHEEEYDKITQEDFDKKMDELFGLLRKYFVNLWD
jgi:hypothetical protein